MSTRRATRFFGFAFIVLPGLLAALLSSTAHAQAFRTWVQGFGDDANPCSRTASCKSLLGAYSKTLAGGEIDAIDAGDYAQSPQNGVPTLTITHSITIDGGGGSLIAYLGNGVDAIVIAAAPTDRVILRNMSINSHPTTPGLVGINIKSAGQVILDNVTVVGFSSAGISVAPQATAASASASPVSVTMERMRLSNNTMGLTVNATGAAATVRLSDSTIQHNTTGLAATNGGSIISFNNNRLTSNGTDGAPTQTIYQR